MRPLIAALVFVHLATFCTASELTRCCAGGHRHFRETHKCTSIRSEGSSTTCARTASICCLRASLDHSCSTGTRHAEREGSCPATNSLNGGGLQKECCDCCLLAKDLLNHGEPCIGAVGFSPACLNSFNKCCDNNESAINENDENSVLLPVDGDRCASAKCDHICNDRGGFEVECSCRSGYELGPDGFSCVDIDECVLQLSDCRLGSQRCLNTPGSYKCIRTLSCGTGYALDSDTEHCIDVDECNHGTHDCGKLYQCRNTQGSYRCDPKKCASNEIMNPRTGECLSVDCPPGYEAKEGKCIDVNECELPDMCGNFEECINSPGSYRCQEIGDLCNKGYEMDKQTGYCTDVNECVDGVHTCGDHVCINLVGSYKCRCKAGFEFNEASLTCEDVNECTKFPGHMCSAHATCINTIGSFECTCDAGFALGADGRICEDIDECSEQSNLCQQKCINTPGSYQCICDQGYQLGIDGSMCEDIDECKTWARRGTELCMGGCTNTIGSFKCECPKGFEVDADGITCRDVDECQIGECPSTDQVCVNTLGSFKCHRIRCPRYYSHDSNLKNRCNRGPSACKRLNEVQCRKHPVHISWQHIAIPRHVNISSQRTSVVLFSMKGPSADEYQMQFELQLIRSRPEYPSVLPAIRSNFLLQKGEERNSAVIALRDSLDGPQEVEMELTLRLSVNGEFSSKFVANLVIFVSKYKPAITPNINEDHHHNHRHHSHHTHSHMLI